MYDYFIHRIIAMWHAYNALFTTTNQFAKAYERICIKYGDDSILNENSTYWGYITTRETADEILNKLEYIL